MPSNKATKTSQTDDESNIRPIQFYVESCLKHVQSLIVQVESKVTSLDDSNGLRRQGRKLKAVLSSKEIAKRIRLIERDLEGVQLCYSVFTRFSLFCY